MGGPPTLPRLVLVCNVAQKQLPLVAEAGTARRQRLHNALATRRRGGGSAGTGMPPLRKVVTVLRTSMMILVAGDTRGRTPSTSLLGRRLCADWKRSGAEWPLVRRPRYGLPILQPLPSPRRSHLGLQFVGEAPRLGGLPGTETLMLRMTLRPSSGLQFEGNIRCLGAGSLACRGIAPGSWSACARRPLTATTSRSSTGAAIAGPPTVQRSDLLSVNRDAAVAPLVADDARRVVVDDQDLAGRPRGPPRDRAELLRRLRG